MDDVRLLLEVGDSRFDSIRFDSMGESIRIDSRDRIETYRISIRTRRLILSSTEFRKLFWFLSNEPLTATLPSSRRRQRRRLGLPAHWRYNR